MSDPQAALASTLQRTPQAAALLPSLARYLRLGLSPIVHPDPAETLRAEAGRFVGWTGGRAAKDRVADAEGLERALQALATALSADGGTIDDLPAFALGLSQGRRIVFGGGWALGRAVEGSTTRERLGPAVRRISKDRNGISAQLILGDEILAEGPIAEVALETAGRLTLRLPSDPDDAAACALLLARGLWGGPRDAAAEAALARLSDLAA